MEDGKVLIFEDGEEFIKAMAKLQMEYLESQEK